MQSWTDPKTPLCAGCITPGAAGSQLLRCLPWGRLHSRHRVPEARADVDRTSSPRLSSCTSPPSPPLSPSFKRLYSGLSLSPRCPQLRWEGREQRAVGGGWRERKVKPCAWGRGRCRGPCGEGAVTGCTPSAPATATSGHCSPSRPGTGLCPPPPHQQADDRIFQISPRFSAQTSFL